MLADRAVSGEFAERGGWEAVHGELRGVLQACEDVHGDLRERKWRSLAGGQHGAEAKHQRERQPREEEVAEEDLITVTIICELIRYSCLLPRNTHDLLPRTAPFELFCFLLLVDSERRGHESLLLQYHSHVVVRHVFLEVVEPLEVLIQVQFRLLLDHLRFLFRHTLTQTTLTSFFCTRL